jgi:ATP-dependent exoDNAse (exonuclease V) beta subunit
MKRETCDIDYDTTSRFAVDGSGGTVDITLINTPRGTAAELQAAVIAQKINDLLEQGVAVKDIAILARSRTHFDILAGTLERAGFAVSVAAEQNACELFEIAVLNNMLFAVSNFYNDVPLVLLMQSFVFGFTPQEMAEIKINGKQETFYKNLVKSNGGKVTKFLNFLDKYRGLSKTDSVADILTTFITEYKIIERLLLLPQGKRAVGNIHAYLNKLRGAPYAVTAGEFLYLLENRQIEIKITPPSSNDDAIQIMTMHSSKGLEFKNVIIFDIGTAFNTNDIKRPLVIDKAQGLCVYTQDSDEFTKTMSIARLGAVISAKRVTVAEEMRLLYVAMTRARERLLIIGGTNVKKLGTGCGDFDIIGAKSDLHFLAPALFGTNHDNCFDLTVVNAEDVNVIKKDIGTRVLAGEENEISKNLRGIYAKEYPYPQAVLKNSVSSLTNIEESKRVKGHGEAGTEYGTRFHKQMQHKDNLEIEKLIPEIKGYGIHREIAFLQQLGDIIVQGVIDLLAIKDGNAIIIDYKTTRANAAKLIELYKPQLDMYAAAVKQAFNPNRISIYIYSTFNQELIKI